MSKQDELDENNELLFKKRFGSGAPHEQWVQVLSVKKFYLTDKDILLFKQSGFMTVGKDNPLIISINFSSVLI